MFKQFWYACAHNWGIASDNSYLGIRCDQWRLMVIQTSGASAPNMLGADVYTKSFNLIS